MSEGITITISGPDRSGKTTLAALIASVLKHYGTEVQYVSKHRGAQHAFDSAQTEFERRGPTVRPFDCGVTIKEQING